jgi:hypothetical protein
LETLPFSVVCAEVVLVRFRSAERSALKATARGFAEFRLLGFADGDC